MESNINKVDLLKVSKTEDELLIRVNLDVTNLLNKVVPLYNYYNLNELEDEDNFISLFIGVIASDVITYVTSGDFVDEVEATEGFISIVKQIGTKLYTHGNTAYNVDDNEFNPLEENLRHFSMEAIESLRDDVDTISLEIINLMDKNLLPVKKILGIYIEHMFYLDKECLSGIGSFIIQIKK